MRGGLVVPLKVEEVKKKEEEGGGRGEEMTGQKK